jgi:acyl-CoA synthetase (AMP-forming)/AMP-acid ligase II
MRGYWRDPAATRAFTADGAVRTGDLGFVDEQGRLRLVGRRRSYVRGGYNVYPAEVEAVPWSTPTSSTSPSSATGSGDG